jgi:hypothetical protein
MQVGRAQGRQSVRDGGCSDCLWHGILIAGWRLAYMVEIVTIRVVEAQYSPSAQELRLLGDTSKPLSYESVEVNGGEYPYCQEFRALTRLDQASSYACLPLHVLHGHHIWCQALVSVPTNRSSPPRTNMNRLTT